MKKKKTLILTFKMCHAFETLENMFQLNPTFIFFECYFIAKTGFCFLFFNSQQYVYMATVFNSKKKLYKAKFYEVDQHNKVLMTINNHPP